MLPRGLLISQLQDCRSLHGFQLVPSPAASACAQQLAWQRNWGLGNSVEMHRGKTNNSLLLARSVGRLQPTLRALQVLGTRGCSGAAVLQRRRCPQRLRLTQQGLMACRRT